ncbi:hypothetical protein, partial [Arthrobacter sp. DR-2P]
AGRFLFWQPVLRSPGHRPGTRPDAGPRFTRERSGTAPGNADSGRAESPQGGVSFEGQQGLGEDAAGPDAL